MKFSEFLSKKAIVPKLKSTTKREVIEHLVEHAKSLSSHKLDVKTTIDAVLKREKIGSTGLGEGVAVPHAKVGSVKKVIAVFGRSEEGIEFNSIDGEPVYIVFLILSPPDMNDEYLQTLQKIMWAIKQQNFCKFLKNATSVKSIDEIFKDIDKGVLV